MLEINIPISMDGKGCWRDNIVIVQFWRAVDQEVVYLKASLLSQRLEQVLLNRIIGRVC